MRIDVGFGVFKVLKCGILGLLEGFKMWNL
jgi:hypothetical protein